MSATLIGVDWGTSNLRIMRIAHDGTVVAVRSDPRGSGGLAAADFPTILTDVGGGWLDDGAPIVACGMVGARGRWREVPYVTAPVSIHGLATGLVSPEGWPNLRIVPGVMRVEGDCMVDVMRGEETQVMGIDLTRHTRIVAPGTHSKWIEAEPGRILGHRTFMTGDLFAAIRKGTILGADMGDPGADSDAFAAGVQRALHDPALTASLFSVRVEGLAGRLSPTGAGDYLSGLLIGAEVAAYREETAAPVILVGAEALTTPYATALALAGFADVQVVDGADATARGLWRIHQASLT